MRGIPIDANELAERLRIADTSEKQMEALREAMSSFSNSAERQRFLNDHMISEPILYGPLAKRLGDNLEPFNVLQGDIIRTEAAFTPTHRRRGGATFLVATATCDLIVGRRESVLLYGIEPRRRSDFASDGDYRSEISPVLKFKTTNGLYLPALPNDDEDVMYNRLRLDDIAIFNNAHLATVERCASLKMLGWRIFALFNGYVICREADDEVQLRMAWQDVPSARRRAS